MLRAKRSDLAAKCYSRRLDVSGGTEKSEEDLAGDMSSEKQTPVQDETPLDNVGEAGGDNNADAAAGETDGDAKAHTLPSETDSELAEASGEPAEMSPEERLEASESQAKAHYDRFLRASAELENFRKRAQREMDDLRRYANQSLIKDLLNVVDNLERAIASSQGPDGSAEPLVEGVDMTLKEILKILQKYGVKPIDALEKPFDPNVHEAVLQEVVEDVPENTVIKEFQRGYWIHDRLLRPSMVVVSKT